MTEKNRGNERERVRESAWMRERSFYTDQELAILYRAWGAPSQRRGLGLTALIVRSVDLLNRCDCMDCTEVWVVWPASCSIGAGPGALIAQFAGAGEHDGG